MSWEGQLGKRQQVYLGEKEEEGISVIRNNGFHDAENLGFVPLLEKESTMEQELADCNKMYDIATYHRTQACVTIKKYYVNKPPYIQIRLIFAKRERNKETRCSCQLYFEQIHRNVPIFGRIYVC